MGTQASRRAQLVAAIEAGDHQAIPRLGWGDVWELLATAWAPRQTCPLSDLRAYVSLLGDAEPEDVIAAIHGAAVDGWRPVPGAVFAELKRLRDDGDPQRVDLGRGRNLTMTAEALLAADSAHAAGAPECSCGHWHPSWRRNSRGVLRCGRCGGLEPGQVYYGSQVAA